jgi:hypothetical protein
MECAGNKNLSTPQATLNPRDPNKPSQINIKIVGILNIPKSVQLRSKVNNPSPANQPGFCF